MKKTLLLVIFSVLCLFLANDRIYAAEYKCYYCKDSIEEYRWEKTENNPDPSKCTINTSLKSEESCKTINSLTIDSTGIESIDFGEANQSCKEFLGNSLVDLLKGIRIMMQVFGIGLAIANGMMSFIPAIVSKDADALNKAFKKFVTILIVLALLMLLPSILTLIGRLFGFDLSCI